MRRCPKRINFRMTQDQFDRYGKMIHGLVYVTNWTDLCLKGLEELANKYKGTWSEPLNVPTHQADGREIEPPLLAVAHERLDCDVQRGAVRPGKPSRNGDGKPRRKKNRGKTGKKKLAGRPRPK